MGKVIITGSSGQDASILAGYLTYKTEHSIIRVSRDQLSSAESIDNLVKEHTPDYFINFAGSSSIAESWIDPERCFKVNTVTVLRQLESIRKYSPSCRYFQSGSSEEFGDIIYSPQDESHQLNPKSPYGASKAAARHLVKIYRETYGLYAVQGWLFNHESCERGSNFVTQKIVTGVTRIAKHLDRSSYQFEPIELGNIDSKRDWSHARDIVKGIWLMLNQSVPKEYVLCSGKQHSVREFVEQAFLSLGYKGEWSGEGVDEKFLLSTQQHTVPLVVINPEFYRPVESGSPMGNSSLARKELNWKPKINFDQLVQEMMECAIAKSTK